VCSLALSHSPTRARTRRRERAGDGGGNLRRRAENTVNRDCLCGVDSELQRAWERILQWVELFGLNVTACRVWLIQPHLHMHIDDPARHHRRDTSTTPPASNLIYHPPTTHHSPAPQSTPACLPPPPRAAPTLPSRQPLRVASPNQHATTPSPTWPAMVFLCRHASGSY
jgi:hypothetical protein